MYGVDCSVQAGLILAVTETSEKYQIRTFRPDGSDERKLVEEGDKIDSARWAPTRNSIYYLHGKEEKKAQTSLQNYLSPATTPEPVVLADGLQSREYFTLSGDGFLGWRIRGRII